MGLFYGISPYERAYILVREDGQYLVNDGNGECHLTGCFENAQEISFALAFYRLLRFVPASEYNRWSVRRKYPLQMPDPFGGTENRENTDETGSTEYTDSGYTDPGDNENNAETDGNHPESVRDEWEDVFGDLFDEGGKNADE